MNRITFFKLCTLFSILFTQNFFAAESSSFRRRLIEACCCVTCRKSSNSTQPISGSETRIASRILPSQQTMLIVPSIATPKESLPIMLTIGNIGSANSAFLPFAKKTTLQSASTTLTKKLNL